MEIPKDTWVKLLPRELKGIEGKVLWRNGTNGLYAVHVPYGDGRDSGAVIYVPSTDLKPIRDEKPRDPFPIDKIIHDIMTQHPDELGVVDLKKLISDAWADYDDLPSEDQYEVFKCVARKVHAYVQKETGLDDKDAN